MRFGGQRRIIAGNMKLVMSLMFAGCLAAQTVEETQVRQLMADFVMAFENLDWPAFRKCWSDNPVVFFPSAAPNPTGRRTDTPAEFDAVWHRQFDMIRDGVAKQGVAKAPFMHLEPKDLRIDFPSPTVAVVTFHLGPGANGIGRRMFVVTKTPAGWKITHLHASNLALAPAQ